MPGATLRHGTYRIEAVLGQGGFGITYLATDLSLDRKVAVKEFFPADYCDRDGCTSNVTLGTSNTETFVKKLKAKFLKEARNIAKLDNPGIIRIITSFEENNTAYYVMEYIEGLPLSEIVKRYGPMSPDRAINYINKVGKALEFVHSYHMNHLDVKPANIMVRIADDTPVLIDFGLSKQYDSEGHQTSTSISGMSPGYAPIEQYNQGGLSDFSPQSDIYSLAATLYYLLSGVVPPEATRLFDNPLSFPPSIPPYLVAPIRKAMSIGRMDRHESMEEFLNEINAGSSNKDYQTPATVMAHSDPRPYNPVYEAAPADESLETSRKVMKWVVALTAVVALAVGIIWWQTSHDNGGQDIAEEVESTEAIPVTESVTDNDVKAGEEKAAPVSESPAVTETVIERPPEPIPASVDMSYGSYRYSGKIGGKYPVHLTLDMGYMGGSYYYDKYGPNNSMTLSVISYDPETGAIVVAEYSPQGEHTGNFVGRITPSKFEGILKTNHGNGKNYNFTLTP